LNVIIGAKDMVYFLLSSTFFVVCSVENDWKTLPTSCLTIHFLRLLLLFAALIFNDLEKVIAHNETTKNFNPPVSLLVQFLQFLRIVFWLRSFLLNIWFFILYFVLFSNLDGLFSVCHEDRNTVI
jgi:hypothetical protein